MTKMLALVVLASVAGSAVAAAGSSSAQMAVSVIVVRSCAVDVRSDNYGPVVRLACTTGTQSALKVSETAQPLSTAVMTERSRVLTLNF